MNFPYPPIFVRRISLEQTKPFVCEKTGHCCGSRAASIPRPIAIVPDRCDSVPALGANMAETRENSNHSAGAADYSVDFLRLERKSKPADVPEALAAAPGTGSRIAPRAM